MTLQIIVQIILKGLKEDKQQNIRITKKTHNPQFVMQLIFIICEDCKLHRNTLFLYRLQKCIIHDKVTFEIKYGCRGDACNVKGIC